MAEVVWLHYALPRTTWYELALDVRAEHEQAWAAACAHSVAAGARVEGTFDIRGHSDYSTVQVWFFPSADSAFDHWARLVDAGYAEWFEAGNSIGSALESA